MDDQAEQYNTKLCEVLDKHTPIKEKRIRNNHHKLWFNDKIKEWNCTKKENRKNLVIRSIRILMECLLFQCRHVANIIKMAQLNYYKEIIHEKHNNCKAIFNIANSLLFRKTDSPIPHIKPLSAPAEGFSEFFYTKIAKIMDKLKLNVSTQNPSKYIRGIPDRQVNMYLYASVPHGCHRDGKISPSKILWTGSNAYGNT